MRKLPEARAVAEMLSGLLDRETLVKPAPKLSLYSPAPLAVARYTDDSGALAAACLMDLRFGCGAGASLTLIPPSIAQASAAGHALPPNLEENLREVLNILARLFNDGGPHVVLRSLAVQPPPLQDDLTLLLRRQRTDYEVTIEAYGPGSLCFTG